MALNVHYHPTKECGCSEDSVLREGPEPKRQTANPYITPCVWYLSHSGGSVPAALLPATNIFPDGSTPYMPLSLDDVSQLWHLQPLGVSGGFAMTSLHHGLSGLIGLLEPPFTDSSLGLAAL